MVATLSLSVTAKCASRLIRFESRFQCGVFDLAGVDWRKPELPVHAVVSSMATITVNIGQSRSIENAKSLGQTGIYKLPVTAPVPITAYGLAGDAICDTENHGGLDQAIYVYGSLDYEWWSNALGQELQPGTFGENLMVSELESTQFSIGDRLDVGTTILEVTAPRIPCVTLAARMGDPGFVKRFRQAERPGFYCRVIQPGWVQAGDAVSCAPHEGETVTVLEMFRDFYEPELNAETLRRYLAAPIAIRDRVEKEKQLGKLLAEGGREVQS
jgi:MOSC domain-containing protein YiiM